MSTVVGCGANLPQMRHDMKIVNFFAVKRTYSYWSRVSHNLGDVSHFERGAVTYGDLVFI